jgi:hypothetical protein
MIQMTRLTGSMQQGIIFVGQKFPGLNGWESQGMPHCPVKWESTI